MKTNAKQIESIANLAIAKTFDAIQTAHYLAREIVGYNKSSDKLIELQKQIDDAKNDKGTRKKAIDGLLKELWTNNVTMVEGKGVTKCPIRVALKEVLSKEGLAEKTIANICGAVSYALKEKKPYDIKYLEKKAQQKKIDDAKKEGEKNASTPASSTPASSTPATPHAVTKVKGDTVTDYIKDMAILCQNAIQASEKRRMLKDDKQQVYADIIELFNEVMDTIGGLK
jgi:heme-binding NEAT domain protein